MRLAVRATRRAFPSNPVSLFSSAQHFKSNPKIMAKWLDVSVIKKNGKVFTADMSLIPSKDALLFPRVEVTTLLNEKAIFPHDISEGELKLISFSISRYGFNLVRSWLDLFREQFKDTPQ
eukprot:gene16196-33959_t